MGVCSSNSKKKNSSPFTKTEATQKNRFCGNNIPETMSQNTQIVSKKDLGFSQNFILDQDESELIVIENENKVNIPYCFTDRKASRPNLNIQNVEISVKTNIPPSAATQLNLKNIKRIASPIKSVTNNVKEYFRAELIKKVLDDAVNANLENYSSYENIYNDTSSALKLQIHLISYKSQRNHRINKFRTEFIAPCTAEQYILTANNLELQKSLDTYCDNYNVLESLEPNSNLLYLSYRKTLVSSPRDFVYLKLVRQIERNGKNYWCDAARSIETDVCPAKNKIIRGEIIKSGHLIEDLSDHTGPKCRVKIYSECDFKIDLPLFVIRNFSSAEMRRFIEKTLRKIKELPRK